MSGRRWHLLVIKLSRCLEISCKWQTHSSKTNRYMSSWGYNWLFKLTLQITDINFDFGGQIKRWFQKPHSLESVSSSSVLTIRALSSIVYLLHVWHLNVPWLFYLTSTWELFFSSVTNLPHAEFGKFYNFIWKIANFKQFGNVQELFLYYILFGCPSQLIVAEFGSAARH